MEIVYLALGSNMGDMHQNMDEAVKLLSKYVSNIEEARRYISRAAYYVDQPDFVNTAIKAKTKLKPLELLKILKQIEQQVGRISRFRNGPREIDIDIIFYGNQLLNDPILQVPHPRFSERDFVLKPLLDIDSDFIDPLSGVSLQELYDNIPQSARSVVGTA